MSTDTHDYKWQGAGTKLPSGHRIFESHNPISHSGWAVADDSGEYPHETEDGTLWLDQSRCLLLSVDTTTTPHQEVVAIPVMDNQGEQSYIGGTAATVLMLSRMFQWTIEDDNQGAYYSVYGIALSAPEPTKSLLERALKSGQLAGTIVGDDIQKYLDNLGSR